MRKKCAMFVNIFENVLYLLNQFKILFKYHFYIMINDDLIILKHLSGIAHFKWLWFLPILLIFDTNLQLEKSQMIQKCSNYKYRIT